MEEAYQRAAYHHHDGYHTRTPPPRYRRPVGTTPNHKLATETSYFTGSNFGILVAVLVIYLFHRKDGFGRLFAARRERGLLNIMMDWLLELQEYAVAYAQMAVELCRNLRLHYLGNLLEDWFAQDMNAPAARNSSSGVPSNGPRGRRRNMVAPVASRITTRMPELEETDKAKLAAEGTTTATKMIINGPLEPAFLKDEDYPPGWLVFDPVLGVVSKVEADKYRQEQENKRKTEEEPRRKQPPPSKQPNSPQPKGQRKQQSAAQYNNNNSNKSSSNKNKATPTRPIRATANVMQNPSPMHTPQTIAANG